MLTNSAWIKLDCCVGYVENTDGKTQGCAIRVYECSGLRDGFEIFMRKDRSFLDDSNMILEYS